MEEISLKECLLILRKRLWLIILPTILFVVASGIISFFVLEPKYQTFTTLMVGNPRDYQSIDNRLEYNDLLLNQKLVPTYGELVKTRVVADQVIDKLNLDMDYNNFIKKANVNLVEDTEIIKLEIVDTDPELATKIANETAIVFMENVKEFMLVDNVQVIDRAQIPNKPISPMPKLNMAIAGVLGLMLGMFLVFLLEYLDNTIKTPEDVERYLGLPVIGTIPMANKNK